MRVGARRRASADCIIEQRGLGTSNRRPHLGGGAESCEPLAHYCRETVPLVHSCRTRTENPAHCGFSTDCLDEQLLRQVNQGSYLLLVEVGGVDDLHYDPSIRVQLLGAATRGTGPCSSDGDCRGSGERCIADECRPVPALSGDRLEAGQPFEVLEPFGYPVPGDIFEGRVRAFPMRLTVPIEMNEVSPRLRIESAEVRFEIADSGLSQGQIGGVVGSADLADELAMAGFPLGCLCWWYGCCDGLRDPMEDWRDLLEHIADIRPSAADPEACDLLSVGVTFGATTARRP